MPRTARATNRRYSQPCRPRSDDSRASRASAVNDTTSRRLEAYSCWYRRAPVGPGAPRREVVDVGFADKFTNRVQELRGRMKRNAGAVSGDRRLEAEGSSEEVRGGLKQAGEKVRDAFRGRGGRRPRY